MKFFNTDIYDREENLISLEDVSGLSLLVGDVDNKDIALEQLHEATSFAVKFLSEGEFNLLFFRFMQGDSYKTLKKNLYIGSTRTAAIRIRKLKCVMREYSLYYMEDDYGLDLKTISSALGEESRMIAEYLFKRWSRSTILKKSDLKIGRNRLYAKIEDLSLYCNDNKGLAGFWNLIMTIGRL